MSEYTGTYLGVTVEIVEDVGEGWCLTEWPTGKLWFQWREQIETDD